MSNIYFLTLTNNMITTYSNKSTNSTAQLTKLRKRARESAQKILEADNAYARYVEVPIEEVQFLAKFFTESAFYIEELERLIDEELTDFWEMREHGLRIVTGQMVSYAE